MTWDLGYFNFDVIGVFVFFISLNHLFSLIWIIYFNQSSIILYTLKWTRDTNNTKDA